MANRLGLALALAAGATGCASSRGAIPHPFPTPAPPVQALPPQTPSLPEADTGLPHQDAGGILQTATALLGTPYRLGGGRPESGFDCSGFVNWVFGQHGVSVPRTVAELFRSGWDVLSGTPLSGGDLVFFDTDDNGASHVGIALGDGRFVHAPNARSAVRIDALSTPYWAQRYLGARRLITVTHAD